MWVEGYAATSAGLSLALPIPVLEESVGQLAAGVTVKYTQGHAVAVGRSDGSLAAETLQADLDSFLIHTRIEDADSADYVNGGSGFGLDLGLMLSLDRLFVGAAVHNCRGPRMRCRRRIPGPRPVVRVPARREPARAGGVRSDSSGRALCGAAEPSGCRGFGSERVRTAG